jgi:Zn-dependent membrane protease YugP
MSLAVAAVERRFMFYYDSTYLLFLIPGILLGLYAQIKMWSAYSKYIRVGVSSGLSGAQAARKVLDGAGLTDVPIAEVPGKLTDHYDPTKRALFLSADNFHERSIAAVGVAAHEAGHALQHQAAYAPLNLRMAMVPITRFASHAWVFIILFGMFFHVVAFSKLLFVAIAIFSVITAFQLITLPVEFDASRRAKEQLFRLGIVQGAEQDAVNKVLNAAAMTYVAALVSSILQLLRLIYLSRNRNY